MDRHPAQLRFIGEKGTQLGEGPAMECCALRPASRYPRANVRQILQRNRPLCAFGLRNNPFREGMVHPGGKAVLLSRQLVQTSATPVGTLSLQLLTQPPMAIAHLLHRGIAQLVDGELAKGLRFPCNLTDVVARFICPHKRAAKGVRLHGRGLQLQLYRKSHAMSIVAYIERLYTTGLKPLKRCAPPRSFSPGRSA